MSTLVDNRCITDISKPRSRIHPTYLENIRQKEIRNVREKQLVVILRGSMSKECQLIKS